MFILQDMAVETVVAVAVLASLFILVLIASAILGESRAERRARSAEREARRLDRLARLDEVATYAYGEEILRPIPQPHAPLKRRQQRAQGSRRIGGPVVQRPHA